MASVDQLRHRIQQSACMDEHRCVQQLLDAESRFNDLKDATDNARKLVKACRDQRHTVGAMDAFLQEFGLSNTEGTAILCLAEALLRVPDAATADRLIAEKIQAGNWSSHQGHSESMFVNASTWGLMLTGRVLELDSEITHQTASWMKQLVHRLGEPVVRQAMLKAMRIMGDQYVLGRTIDEAVQRAESTEGALQPASRFSFDMLGESARTRQDAKKYFDAYCQAIITIGEQNKAASIEAADGISVKLSALHPRYCYAQKGRVIAELLPQLQQLSRMASNYGIGLSLDAEEHHRLDLAMDIFERLAADKELAGWHGLGFVLQSYQKVAPLVADWLISLAQQTGRRLMVRLVKGAYWDVEIKQAQQQGLEDYPVFTRKVNTDLCYQHCARKLLAEPESIYPQLATHNAQTMTSVLALSKGNSFEFQRLHGMGGLLYQQLQQWLGQAMPPVRIYAPVGEHRELLPYLVRRLLENGANSSFVNRFLDREMAVDELVDDIATKVAAITPHRHPAIPLPRDIYKIDPTKPGAAIAESVPRKNATGINLSNPQQVELLLQAIAVSRKRNWLAEPIVGGIVSGEGDSGSLVPVRSPADSEKIVGHYRRASVSDVDNALELAQAAQLAWDGIGGDARGNILEQVADLLESSLPELMALIIAEAGRTVDDALSEVREAVDFCRYYGQLGRQYFTDGLYMPGPTGEENRLSLHGRGVFACISPWNFPASIFTGQIVAALAAGNSVLAKPAALTPLVAAKIVQLFHQGGVPGNVLHLLPGSGATLGNKLLSDVRVGGVAFTGSMAVAKHIQQQLACRTVGGLDPIIPLIAETGGQNVMVVDSTALPEQVVDDVISSAFLSAGQRCSSLRVLFLQNEVADNILDMLCCALPEYVIGDPADLATDIGPVIDQSAHSSLLRHIEKMQAEHTLIAKGALFESHRSGFFIPPYIFEIDNMSQLTEEVFGPILHVIRYDKDNLAGVIQQINDCGYGLTLGIHSRIQGFADAIFRQTRVGNTYINRNMVGAVVGTNPFGGCGLSGTGPKAGGPYYLLRFASEKNCSENLMARGGNLSLFSLKE